MDRMPNWHTPIPTRLYTTSKRTTYKKIWRTTWTRMTRRLPNRPPLKDECQDSRQYEGRMLEFGTTRICWASSQNVQYPPPQR